MKMFDMDATVKTTGSFGKLPDERKKKKKPNLPPAAWSAPAAPSGGVPGKENEGSAGAEAPAAHRPSYGEVMGQYYADRCADELAGNKRTAEAAAVSAADTKAPTASFTASIWKAAAHCRSALPRRASPAG